MLPALDEGVLQHTDEAIQEAESSRKQDAVQEAELERQADVYLAACGAVRLGSRGRKNTAKVFTEQQIRDKCGRDWHPELGVLKSSTEELELEYMTVQDLKTMSLMCKMSDRQYAVVELWVRGMRHSDIAEALNESRRYVTETLQRCCRRILDKWQTTPWFGMWTVYYELVNRG